jgi:glycosyltransferase involved in cell wall biosynthesis
LEGRVFCCNVSNKFDIGAVRQLAQYIQDEAVDIIVCTNPYPLLYAWLARIVARRRPRLVEIFHTTELDTFKSKLQMLFLYRPLFLISDMLVYVCKNQKNYWQSKALKAKCDSVIYNGIDVNYFADRYTAYEKNTFREQFGFGSDDYVVGLCAFMRPEKAHEDLLQAIANLRARHLNVKCLLIGDGPERSRIDAKIHAMGLASHVGITGLMIDVRKAIIACDVMALVSHHIETFSIAALEAMALGKPMIMSDIGGANEQIIPGQNGYLYKRGDIDALADALYQLMESKKRSQMAHHARSIVVHKFSLGAMVNAYDQLFVRLAEPHA